MKKLQIRVANVKERVEGISIMRKSSPLGNPFIIGKHGDRAAVIAKYRKWLWQELNGNPASAVNKELKRLLDIARGQDGLTMTCCCKPLPCHGDVLKSCLEWLNGLE